MAYCKGNEPYSHLVDRLEVVTILGTIAASIDAMSEDVVATASALRNRVS